MEDRRVGRVSVTRYREVGAAPTTDYYEVRVRGENIELPGSIVYIDTEDGNDDQETIRGKVDTCTKTKSDMGVSIHLSVSELAPDAI